MQKTVRGPGAAWGQDGCVQTFEVIVKMQKKSGGPIGGGSG